METVTMKVTEEKLKCWNLLIEERKQRGLKVEDFCKEKNITVPQFYFTMVDGISFFSTTIAGNDH